MREKPQTLKTSRLARQPDQKRQRLDLTELQTNIENSEREELTDLTKARQVDRNRRMRRNERSKTSEWLCVGPEDQHKYSKVSDFGYGSVSLKEYTLRKFQAEMTSPPRQFVEEMCDVCSGQHTIAECPRGSQDPERKEMVHMGKLFSFATRGI